MFDKTCDHTSVGMIVRNGEDILLIERKKFPYGFAVPAGHVDGDASFEEAAKRELKEEVGLNTQELKLLAEGRKNNLCRREGGSWHFWKVYGAVVEGELNRSEDETKQAAWFSPQQIKEFAARTELYLNGTISEEEWQNEPGLEPVMQEWFKELNII